jgi:hypothetical protein
MQNEFEKQVQQKMEELKLVPSEPVWQKVEMQIRKKKDRRRLVFWIPLFALLLGGGLWFVIDQYSNNISYNKSNDKKIDQQTQKQNSAVQREQSITEQTINTQQEQDLKTTLSVQPEKKPSSKTITSESISFRASSGQKNSTQRIKLQKENLVREQEKKSVAVNKKTVFIESQITNPDIVTEKVKENEPASQKLNLTDPDLTGTLPDTKTDSIAEIEKETATSTLKIDSVNNDSTSIKNIRTKKYVVSKWKPVFTVGSGVSGSGKLNVFNGFLSENKSMDYASAPNAGGAQNGGITYYPPSEVKKDFSFAVQAGVKKQLAKRTFFSAGLQYSYYSNSIQVGNRVAQNTSFGNYSVTQYFSNNRNNYSSISWLSYHNKYHFISLPLNLDWQLLKKHPLNLSAGLSLQYLVQTNGLIFDYNKQAYFHNKNAFNRMQLFSHLGLNYSFPIKKTSIAIGPELQYGISRLEKSNSNHHLYTYGLKAQLQLP